MLGRHNLGKSEWNLGKNDKLLRKSASAKRGRIPWAASAQAAWEGVQGAWATSRLKPAQKRDTIHFSRFHIIL